MKLFKISKIYFLIGLIATLGVQYYFFSGEEESSQEVQQSQSYETAEVGDIKESISVFGTAELVDEQTLQFNQSGKITKVNFSEGDAVNNGDIIAEMDSTQAQYQITQARLSLENAQVQLEQLYEDVDESQIISAENSINQSKQNITIAEKELENLKVEIANSLQETEDSIDTKEKDIEDLKKDNSNSLVNISDSIEKDIFTISQSLEGIDYIIGATTKNEDKNNEYESNLSDMDPSLLTNAQDYFRTALKAYETLESYSGEDLETYLNLDLVAFEGLEKAAEYTYKALNNSSESENFTSSEISSKKSTVSGYKTSSQSSITTIKNYLNQIGLIETSGGVISSLDLSLEKAEKELVQLKESYELSKQSYDVKLESKENEIANLKVTLELNEQSYEELLEGPTEENIKLKENSITQAEISLADAIKDLEDYQLEAPFDGVIRKMDIQVGDNLNNDTEKYVYIENPDLFEISVYLDQIDIITVETGTKAEVEFDSYSGEVFEGEINLIDTTPVDSSGVVSYEVKIIVTDDNFDKRILSGMTANIEIIIEEKENVILVSTSAISTNTEGKNVVKILNDEGQTEEVEVEIGAASFGQTEIISGISEGDKIVTTTFSMTGTGSDEEDASGFSLFPSGGGRGDRQGRGGGMGGGPPRM